MNQKDRIISYLQRRTEAGGGELSRHIGVSRQALNVHLKDLVSRGLVVREGITRGARYRIMRGSEQGRAPTGMDRSYRVRGLEEDRVFADVSAALGLSGAAGPRAREIVQYAFTEMLNNAIEHSRSERVAVSARVAPYACSFVVRDWGVGLFHSVASRFRLEDENASVVELLKGKTTTAPDRHTGEGIFFTSKAVDTIAFRSHRIRLVFDNTRGDVFVEQSRFLKGTEVEFAVGRRVRRVLRDIFSEFAPEEYSFQFEKTRVIVRLLGKDYVSRSEARRLMAGLDRFKEVELDFDGVKSLGQGFADEVFRVFTAAHPGVQLRAVRISPLLQAVIRHVIDNNSSANLTIT